MMCNTNAAARNFTVGPPSARSLTLIEMCGCDCVLILASAVSECCGQKNSRCKPVPSGAARSSQSRQIAVAEVILERGYKKRSTWPYKLRRCQLFRSVSPETQGDFR